MSPTILLVPGYLNSAPDHWQSLWENEHPNFHRVNQRDWENPNRTEWIQTLDQAVRAIATPILLVGHSCGSVLIPLWAEQCPVHTVTGALLVAPADCEAPNAIPAIKALAPMSRSPLPFPSILVAGTDDPYMTCDRSKEFAQAWGSRFEIIKGGGHITATSGYGPWPEGKRFLEELGG